MAVVRGVDLGGIEELLQTLLKNLGLFLVALVFLPFVFLPLSFLPSELGWFFDFSFHLAVFLLPLYFLARLLKRARGVPIWEHIHSDDEIVVRRSGELSYLSKGTFYSVMYGHLVLLAGALWFGLHDVIVNQEGTVGYLTFILDEGGFIEAVQVASILSVGTADLSAHAIHLFIAILLAFSLITVMVTLFEQFSRAVIYGPDRLQRLFALLYLEYLVIKRMVSNWRFYANVALGALLYVVLSFYISMIALLTCLASYSGLRCIFL